MRLGVLDIGSNTGHLLVVDAHGGAAPLPAFSYKQPLRLAEHLDESGAVSEAGIDALTRVLPRGRDGRRGQGLRGHARLRHLGGARRGQLRRRPGPRQRRDRGRPVGAVGGGRGAADLPRRTPLVRLVGRPAGGLRHRRRLAGDRRRLPTRRPTSAWSLPLGAARLARDWFGGARPDDEAIRRLRRQIRADIARDAGNLLRPGAPDRAAATSKTFRSLARICGAAPSGDGPLVPRSPRARPRSRSGSPS